jgi:hypothetical protein
MNKTDQKVSYPGNSLTRIEFASSATADIILYVLLSSVHNLLCHLAVGVFFVIKGEILD